MPGAKDNRSFNADFLSAFELYRTSIATNDGPISTISETIDLGKTISAVNQNKIYFILDSNSKFTVTGNLYLKLAEGDLAGNWYLAEVYQNMPTNALIRFERVYAGEYKLQIKDHPMTDSFDVYESHTSLSWDTKFQHS
mgnify:CR=1 FL=1